MLVTFARYSGLDLDIHAAGDLPPPHDRGRRDLRRAQRSPASRRRRPRATATAPSRWTTRSCNARSTSAGARTTRDRCRARCTSTGCARSPTTRRPRCTCACCAAGPPSRRRGGLQGARPGAARRAAPRRRRVQHQGLRRATGGDPVTLTRRVIVCLDVTGGRVVKGVQFVRLRDVGDPVDAGRALRGARAPTRSSSSTSPPAPRSARRCSISRGARPSGCSFRSRSAAACGPSTTSAARCAPARTRSSINSAAVARPECSPSAAERFGAQCVVASIDAKRATARRLAGVRRTAAATPRGSTRWRGRASACERGAGEILLTSIDRDGARTGYDLELTRAVAEAVDVPVIASRRRGERRSMSRDAFATAAPTRRSSPAFFTSGSPLASQERLAQCGIPVRPIAEH